MTIVLPFKILTPCGTWQERLFYWGSDVKVAVTTKIMMYYLNH